MDVALNFQPEFSREAWARAWATAFARLNEAQRESLAVSSLLPTPEALAECAHEGPVHWKSNGGDPTLQAVWSLALRELVPAPLPTIRVDDETWRHPRIVAANLVLTRAMRWSAPIVVLGDVSSPHPLYDCGPDSCVTIVGNLTAPGLLTSGEMQICGDVDCRIIEGRYNDNVLVVLGRVRADVIYEEQHACNWAGPLDVKVHASLGDDPKEQDLKLQRAIAPGFLDEDGPDGRLRRAMVGLALGESVFL